MCASLVLLTLASRLTGQEQASDDPIRLGSYALHGTLEGGLRMLDVDGDQAQYEEDLNLEAGAFLSAFALRGEGAGAVSAFALDGQGLGEPFAALRLQASGGPWTTLGHYERSQYAGRQDGDLHAFDLERETGGLSFAYEPGPGQGHARLDLDLLDRDGTWSGSRSVGLEFVRPFPARRRERALSARTELGAELDELLAELEFGFEDRESRDRDAFTLPSSIFPGSTWSEDHSSSTVGRSGFAALRIVQKLQDGAGAVDLGLAWHGTDQTGDLDLTESGFLLDPSLPFERDTEGDLALEAEELGLDLGIRAAMAAGTEVELRFRRERETEDGEVERTTILDELSGEPPSVFLALDTLDEESRLDLVELSLEQALGSRAALDVRVEWGRETLEIREVVEGVTTRFFDGSLRESGAEARLALELPHDVRLELGGGSVRKPTASTPTGVDFDFEDERSSFASSACRWRVAQGITLALEARLEHEDSQAFDSEGDIQHLACSAEAARARWRAAAAFVYQSHEVVTDVLFPILGPGGSLTQVPGQSTFEGLARTLDASFAYELSEAFRPALSFSGAIASGDGAFDSLFARLDLPWEFQERFVLGLRAWLHEFDGEGALDDSDYDAEVLEVYLRSGF